MKTRQNDLAMPVFQPYLHPDNDPGTFHTGLTKREYFAAMAMQGILSNPTGGNDRDGDLIARSAVAMADRLINELNKETTR